MARRVGRGCAHDHHPTNHPAPARRVLGAPRRWNLVHRPHLRLVGEKEGSEVISIMRFNPIADGLERWLGPLEAACMVYVWECDHACTAKRMARELARTQSTIALTLRRLVRKGLLTRRAHGPYGTYRYTPTCTEDEFVELQIAAVRRGISDDHA